MAITNFIPEIWSTKILDNLNKAHVFAQAGVVNRDYEGEIRGQGDKVRINALGRVSVRPYVQATGLSDPEQLDSSQQELDIDQASEFNFRIDDIDAAQGNVKLMTKATQEAAYALSDELDAFIAALYVDAGQEIGTDASPVSADAAGEAYELLVDAAIDLDEQNVPRQGRWAVITPEFLGYLLKDERFIDASKSGSTDALLNAEVGRAAGFRILESNNAPSVDGDGSADFDNRKVIAGHSMGWSVAEQITKTEAYRPDKFFADALRGLHVYGAKVVRPEALVVVSYDSTVPTPSP